MKTIVVIIALFLVTIIRIEAQEKYDTKLPLKIGTELDILPYATGGYYGSVWIGKGHFRVRPVVSFVNVPSFVIKEGYKENKLMAYAFLADYFFKNDFKGFWIGTGFEYWDASIIKKEDLLKRNYDNTVFTIGGGYVLNFYKNFYLNPWAAGHLIIGGNRTVNFPSGDFKPSGFTPEASLKIGWHF
ncbi:MAG: hypothetical protein Q8859_00530 [Bacteroidota bacterium]|nr:hypothetical protein [Bacteroidota bacterium]